jgi:hypothetical protein
MSNNMHDGAYRPSIDGTVYSTDAEKAHKAHLAAKAGKRRSQRFRGDDDGDGEAPLNNVHQHRIPSGVGRLKEIRKTIEPRRATGGVLAELEAAGTISKEVRASGQRFAETFSRGWLDDSKAAARHAMHMLDAGIYTDRLPDKVESAKDVIRGAMRALGGIGDVYGSVVWHCIGLGESLESWTQRRKLNRVGHSANVTDARRFLVRGLRILDEHFRPRTEVDTARVVDGSLKDLVRLIPQIAELDDPAAGWFAAALRQWSQNPEATLESALGVQVGARRRDIIRRRDAAIRRLADKLRYRSAHKAAVMMPKLVADFRATKGHADNSATAADLREIVGCGGLPSFEQLRRILGGKGGKIFVSKSMV